LASLIEIKRFADIPLTNPFFDSLKEDYGQFEPWFRGKISETAYVQYSDDRLVGFMYLKPEDIEIADVAPLLPAARRIKIGTFKVEAHGTKLGERLLKKAFDRAVVEQVAEIYVTIFPKHELLIGLLEEFGFKQVGTKSTSDGVEQVLLKNIDREHLVGDIKKDYPMINIRASKQYILSIKPEWHSKLFPDSILRTESYDLLSDISHTNSISKTYVCSMADVGVLKRGDILAIYRTSDSQGPAEYRSVITSICTVEDMRPKASFADCGAYISFTEPYSVFNEQELRGWWNSRKNLFIIKMLYNAAFTQRVIRKTLIEDVGLQRDIYWGFVQLNIDQLIDIMNRGGIDGRLIIN
jgi:L-amino acid N-acyltransferase YncA